MRGLAKSPTFTAVAVLSLAVGIGVNAAVFSVVDAMLFRPFPYDDPEGLVTLQAFETSNPTSTRDLRLDEYLSWKPHTDVFEEMAFANDFTIIGVRSTGHPTEELWGQSVSTNLFATLGVEPLLGRGFLPEDGQSGAENVVVLSHNMWQRRFGGDGGVIGETLWLNDSAAIIIGRSGGDPIDFVESIVPLGTDHAGFVRAVEEATRRLVQQRFLLEEDVPTLIRHAEMSDVLQ